MNYPTFPPLAAQSGRRAFFKGTVAAGAGLTLANMGLLRAAAQGSETVTDIINIASTAEAMAVTLLGAALNGAAQYDGGKGLPAPIVTILKAAQSSEQAHYAFLTGAGAKPLTLSFNLPDPNIATSSTTLFQTIEKLESAFIAAYMAATREFAAMGQSQLVKVALQVGAVEAEHRALARVAQGDALPHNLAFEVSMFNAVGDAAAALKQLGFIGGTGAALAYPGPFAVDNTGMTELTPSGPLAWVTNDPTVGDADQFGRALWATQHGGDPSGFGSISRADQVTWNSVAIHGR